MKAIRNPRDLAKHILAERGITYAMTFVPLVRKNCGTEAGAAAYGAICAYYSRPFLATNRGLGGVSTAVVPTELKETHEELIKHRHQIFAHTDAEAKVLGVSINSIVFDVSASEVSVGNHFICPSETGLEKIARLLETVRGELSKSIRECLNSSELSERRMHPGSYYLNLATKQGPWLIPAE